MNPPQDGTAGTMRGLTTAAATESRTAHGRNVFSAGHRTGVLVTLRQVFTEPMFLLLLLTCAVYLGLGQTTEGATLGAALVAVGGISVYQQRRSDRALGALRDLTQPTAQVWRDGAPVTLAIADLVVGDVLLVTEGSRLPADGTVHDPNDFTVDEAVLTGESVTVSKAAGDAVFAGTGAATGRAWMTVTAVGAQTELGRIGRSLETIQTVKTPLQVQINTFVLRMAWIGVGAFVLVCGVNYARSGDWVSALLFGLTLAMAVLPEEIPVAFSSFMALGAARLGRLGVLTRQPQTVESLGSATVICTDKTGTLTQEGMTLRQVYDAATQTLLPVPGAGAASAVLVSARLASETAPFDPMERAIAVAYVAAGPAGAQTLAPMIHEYPLGGVPPMMTHVRQAAGQAMTVTAKGAVERILGVCRADTATSARVREVARELSAQGYRVLGVAQATPTPGGFPERQDDFAWTLSGLIALENPPKANAGAVIRAFGEAGIVVKLITGDSPETAQAIARQVGIPAAGTVLTGEQVMAMKPDTLRGQAGATAVFARMFPEAKLRVVEALKAAGEVVAMTGDGVNDAPALKAAHIGVAMGQRGSEVARQAASLVLVRDDLGGMVDAVAQGRRIYSNLQKAVAYIVAIHIPIILTVAAPLLLGWRLENLLSPIHIIVLELVMGPTCSVAFENEPAEPGQMRRPPRRLNASFLAGRELGRSVAQGLGITLAVLGIYLAAMTQGQDAPVVRTLVFTTLVLSNILLVLVSRSFTLSAVRTLRTPNRVLWLLLGLTLALLLTTLFFGPAQRLFGFAPVPAASLGWCALAALLGVGWIEGFKAAGRAWPRPPITQEPAPGA
ncbi:cation-translocating P-type ATPase [Deinococcus sp. LM3]|uniref:cation-translocating P-type ATPase n=1 Tax=Deinococcus sp. LM3 TaxID=1938608 RepID=UPI00196A4C13|nr:cation-translocating P-type ATPase [Deinococcus sp. LM3]